EKSLVEARRLVEQLEQAPAPLTGRILARRRVVVLERDVEALAEPLDGADEAEALRLANEGKDSAALPAAEAVVLALRRVDGEARGALLVERAATGVLRSRLAERRPLLGHTYEVGSLAHRLDRRVLEPSRHVARAWQRSRARTGPSCRR